MDLQRELIESRKNQRKRGGWKASATSLGIHAMLLAGVVYAGSQEVTHKIAPEKPISAFISQGAAPPPPPPPPPPAPSSGAQRQATPRVQPKPVEVPRTPLTPPVQIPKEVPKIEAPVTADVPVVNTPVEEAPAAGTFDGAAGDAAAGVPGGVAGGVAGGVVGGEVGGVVGGEIGGVKGGEIGGVLGGKVGGTGTGTEGSGTGGADAPVVPDPPPAPSGPMRVGGDVKAPVIVDRADPEYTEVARKARVSGVVVVEAIIDKNGRVQDVKIIKGLPMGLGAAAEAAVRKWRFKPGTLNGQPVATIFNLTVNFKLDN